MSDEKTQTDTEYRIKADIPEYFYIVFKNPDYGEIVLGNPSRLEMSGGGKKSINNTGFIEILPKKEGEEIIVSEEQIKKYTQITVTSDEGKELVFDAELGCNCTECKKDEIRCPAKYRGEIVVMNIGGEERYFAK